MSYNGDLINLYRLASFVSTLISSELRWQSHVTEVGETRNAHRILLQKTLKNPRNRSLVNSKMFPRELGYEDCRLMELAENFLL